MNSNKIPCVPKDQLLGVSEAGSWKGCEDNGIKDRKKKNIYIYIGIVSLSNFGSLSVFGLRIFQFLFVPFSLLNILLIVLHSIYHILLSSLERRPHIIRVKSTFFYTSFTLFVFNLLTSSIIFLILSIPCFLSNPSTAFLTFSRSMCLSISSSNIFLNYSFYSSSYSSSSSLFINSSIRFVSISRSLFSICWIFICF